MYIYILIMFIPENDNDWKMTIALFIPWVFGKFHGDNDKYHMKRGHSLMDYILFLVSADCKGIS